MSDQNESSDESDEEYVPPTKQSKPTNSGSEDQEQDLAQKDHKCNSLDKQTLDALWQDFKQDTASFVSPFVPNQETESKTKENKPIETKSKYEEEVSNLPPRKCSSRVDETEIRAPRKSRLNHLLTARAMKKRDKPENILHSSKHDWERLKVREDLSEELTHHNKDGFIQRQDFLKRCEEREHDDLLDAKKRKK